MYSIDHTSINGLKKGLWKEDEKWRWTSSWTSPPSPIGHIFSSELVWAHQVNYQVNKNASATANEKKHVSLHAWLCILRSIGLTDRTSLLILVLVVFFMLQPTG